MRLLAAASIIFGLSFGALAHAGLIVERTSGSLTAGDTMTFDLIMKNEPKPPPIGPTPAPTWTFDSIDPVVFSSPVALDSSSPNPTFSLAPAPNWDFDDTLGDPLFFLDPAIPDPITLAPMESVHFGVLSVDFPAGFSGGFQMLLLKTITLVDAFAADPVVVGPSDWSGQENAPFGTDLFPPPQNGGSGPAAFVVTAVPEPSPFLLLSLLGTLVCVRSRQKFLSQFA